MYRLTVARDGTDRGAVWVHRTGYLLCTAGAVYGLWGLWLLASHGTTFTLFGIHFSANVRRPLTHGAVMLTAGLILSGRCERWLNRPTSSRAPRLFAAALAILTFALGVSYGSFVASAADAYGYVSQGDLWRQGTLVVEAPLAAEATWPNGALSMIPVGYQPGPSPGTMVPTYPPGLPLAMAAAQLVGGARAAFMIVPLLGALAVWGTFRLGVITAGPGVGLLAASLLLASPVFLFHLMMPMSDVPATAWWVAAIVGAAGTTRRSAALSGAATAFAIVTRPNLVVLAIPLALLFVLTAPRPRLRNGRLVLWAGVAALGPLCLSLIGWYLYGSPFRSGYGRFEQLYGLGFAATNLRFYGGWLLETQTIFILAGLPAPWLAWRSGDARGARLSLWLMAFSAVVGLSYLFYMPFEDWTFLRFLLPAFPALLVTASATLAAVASALPHGRQIAAVLALLLVARGFTRGDVAFRIAQDEARYRDAARLVERLPANAIVFANLHSGSVRYYTKRLTVRFEWLEAATYGVAVRELTRRGYQAYVMLDAAETGYFSERFAATDLSWMHAPAVGALDAGVVLYRLPQP